MNAIPASPLFRTLPEGALDVIGDVHGEWAALQSLLHHLGYDDLGRYPHGRKLVFVGDLCDRGADSPAVLAWVLQALAAERAWSILGNHELNLLIDDPKDGSGWYFPYRDQDERRYAPWRHLADADKSVLKAQLQQWPLLLHRADLRIVHAAWLPESLQRIAAAGVTPLLEQYRQYEADFTEQFRRSRHFADYQREQNAFQVALENEYMPVPRLPGMAQYDLECSHANPIRALTSGVEVASPAPFYANGRWHFTTRSPWWQHYREDGAVLIGHYWRRWQRQPAAAGRLPLFPEAPQS